MYKRRQPRHRKPTSYAVATRRLATHATTVMAGTAVAGTVLSPSASAVDGPSEPALASRKADRLGDYVPQRLCDPRAKPGTLALANLALSHYHAGYSGGISRSCGIGGTSEHKEGRAWDWMLDANDPEERAVAEEFIDWLTARGGPDNQRAYNARRLGVMYIIWNRQIWGAYRADEGWRPYDGDNPHTDHIHISLTWAGALGRTSWFTGTRYRVSGQDAPASLAASAASGSGTSGERVRYRVVSGDTLSELAAQYRTTVGEIQDANDLSGDLILVGQVLVIPT